jgi:hypothetical protein
MYKTCGPRESTSAYFRRRDLPPEFLTILCESPLG